MYRRVGKHVFPIFLLLEKSKGVIVMADEQKLETWLVKECKKRGYYICKFTSPNRTGVPDRIIINKYHTVFIELKANRNTLSERQKSEILDIRASGGIASETRNKEELLQLLENMNLCRTKKSLINTVPWLNKEIKIAEAILLKGRKK